MLSGRRSLFFALALGILAGATAWTAMRVRERRVAERWKTTHVLCANTDIAEGTELTPAMIAVAEIPARFVTASFIQADESGNVLQDSPVGQRVMVPLKAGDPILLSHFESVREPGFSALITPKGRAVTIEVQEKSAVGLWVRPNDHVDVVGSFRDPQTQQLRAMTLLQNVVVLATGRITAGTAFVPEDDKRFSTVTLLALPEEAEMLTIAQELGTLTLLLRNPEDLDAAEKRIAVDQKTLFAGERANELQQQRYRTIQIIRGNRGGVSGERTP
jgi:pilus assembly protein CpaB